MRKWSFVGKCLRKFKLQKYFARRTFWGLARLIFWLVNIINRAWQKGKLANLFSLHPGTRTVFKIDCIVTKRSRLLEWNISVTKLVTDQGLFCSLHQRHHALALFYCHHKQPAQAMGVWKRYCVYSLFITPSCRVWVYNYNAKTKCLHSLLKLNSSVRAVLLFMKVLYNM